MQPKTTQILLITAIAICFLGAAFSGGVLVGWMVPFQGSSPVGLFPTAQPSTTTSAKPVDTQTLFKPFWDAWSMVHNEYVDQPVDDVALMRGAIKGMIEALGDTHSSYWDPTIYKNVTADLTGKTYEGIGAWVDTTGEFLKIVSPMPGSPALKAGIKTGDLIIAVDKEDMTGKPGDIVLQRVVGPAGSSVVLTILRKGVDKPFDLTITREKITMPQVDGKILDNNIAYIKLFTFGDQTAPDLHRYLTDLLAKKPAGLILDLRGNGGGWLDSAISVVSEFIQPGTIVMYEQYGDGTRTTYKAKTGGVGTEIPLVVLVNEGSASASEITAGAIQDMARGILVGAKTYGKGSVQHITPLKDDGGAVRITVARWLTPKDRQINKIGLTPDVVVPITDDDIKNGRDPQLDKAVQILLAGVK